MRALCMLTGNEFTYAFTGLCNGPITVKLTPQDPKQALGVGVLDGAKGCAPAACTKSKAASAGAQELVVDVVKGQLYYVVVDSEAKPGDFQIELSCQCGPPVVCGDAKCDALKEDCSVCAKDCGECNKCGDGKCLVGVEDCKSCQADCGVCTVCGDGKCNAVGGETCANCAADCGKCNPCGDGKCDPLGGEECDTCKIDCGACPTTCQPVPATLTCGSQLKAGIAGVGSTKAITNWSCLGGNHSGKEQAWNFAPSCSGFGMIKVVRDAGGLGNLDVLIVDKTKTCDGSSCLAFGPMLNGTAIATFAAEKGKTYQVVVDSTPGATASFTLYAQCIGCSEGCGDQTCSAATGETCQNCGVDCGLCAGCGDKKCEGNETCQTCPGDCGECPWCGDGACNGAEKCDACLKDCGKCGGANPCGDSKCDAAGGENCTTCAADCGACPPQGAGCAASTKPGCGGCACEACVCKLDDYCCAAAGAWTNYCVNLCKSSCGGKCP